MSEEKIKMELSKEELQRLFDYMDEGLDNWFEYHQKNNGAFEFDSKLKARLENVLYMIQDAD